MGKKRQTFSESEEYVIPYARGRFSTPTGNYEFYYPKGLRWSCKRCGFCCRDSSKRPRKILLLPKDVERLGKIGEKDFQVEVKGEDPFVGEMKKTRSACVFLTKEGCRVYPSRALLCRTYPFWIERDGKSFEIRFDAECMGIFHGGELKEDFFKELVVQALEQRGDA